ncbi:MAG: septum formation inhibitor Maf [Gammaproteobacteria bacterium]|jgi:septum formation protein|nr:septum formation inhibitor Maf [Gammaproteobacteria bacterium]
MSVPKLHLASSSPRRRQILERMGLEFTAAGVDVDERRQPGESADIMVLRLAVAKACAVEPGPGIVILGADTAVVLDGEVFGKPAGETDALRMLAALSGRRHEVMTGVAVRSGDSTASALSVTEVKFREIRPDEALEYWQSGEPRGKAGAYAIQGYAGAFVEEIAGSYTGVVGLPVLETAELLRAAGIEPSVELKDAI